MSNLLTPFILEATNNSLLASPGAKLYSYKGGTTTPTPIYLDKEVTTPATNPVIADNSGRFPVLWIDANVIYKFRMTDASDVLIGDEVDGYDAVNTAAINYQFGQISELENSNIPDTVQTIFVSGRSWTRTNDAAGSATHFVKVQDLAGDWWEISEQVLLTTDALAPNQTVIDAIGLQNALTLQAEFLGEAAFYLDRPYINTYGFTSLNIDIDVAANAHALPGPATTDPVLQPVQEAIDIAAYDYGVRPGFKYGEAGSQYASKYRAHIQYFNAYVKAVKWYQQCFHNGASATILRFKNFKCEVFGEYRSLGHASVFRAKSFGVHKAKILTVTFKEKARTNIGPYNYEVILVTDEETQPVNTVGLPPYVETGMALGTTEVRTTTPAADDVDLINGAGIVTKITTTTLPNDTLTYEFYHAQGVGATGLCLGEYATTAEMETITNIGSVDNIAGTFTAGETITWTGGTGVMKYIDDFSYHNHMAIIISTGVAATNNQVITGSTSGATCQSNGIMSAKTNGVWGVLNTTEQAFYWNGTTSIAIPNLTGGTPISAGIGDIIAGSPGQIFIPGFQLCVTGGFDARGDESQHNFRDGASGYYLNMAICDHTDPTITRDNGFDPARKMLFGGLFSTLECVSCVIGGGEERTVRIAKFARASFTGCAFGPRGVNTICNRTIDFQVKSNGEFVNCTIGGGKTHALIIGGNSSVSGQNNIYVNSLVLVRGLTKGNVNLQASLLTRGGDAVNLDGGATAVVDSGTFIEYSTMGLRYSEGAEVFGTPNFTGNTSDSVAAQGTVFDDGIWYL